MGSGALGGYSLASWERTRGQTGERASVPPCALCQQERALRRAVGQVAVRTGVLLGVRVPVVQAHRDRLPVTTGMVATRTLRDVFQGLATWQTDAGAGCARPQKPSGKGGRDGGL